MMAELVARGRVVALRGHRAEAVARTQHLEMLLFVSLKGVPPAAPPA